MKIASFEKNEIASYGVITDDGIIDLGSRLGSKFPALIDVLEADAMDEIIQAIVGADADYLLNDITFQIPITKPEKIICIGVNYANRNEEYKDASDAPKFPSLFMRSPGSFVGHNQNIIRPPESEQLDYEGEIVLVIGKGGRRIKADNYLEHIAGFTIMNEGTIRDWCRHAKFNVTQGKNFFASGSIGPWLITRDEVSDLGGLSIQTRINSEVRQDDSIGNMIFKFPYLLNYLSTFFDLKPGDLIATGTPVGAGARFDPPVWLKPGDIVEFDVPAIGKLSNVVADEKLFNNN